MKLSSFDLNHVRALHFLLEEAHVARAAKKLGITSAAASNALRRLREEFDDPLLVRSGRSLRRTPLAERLREGAREVVDAARRMLEETASFEPADFDGVLTLTTSDRVAEALLPALDELLAERAPKAIFVVRTMTVDVATELRERGGVAIVPAAARERELCDEPLYSEDFVCLLRKGHPLGKGSLTVQRFARAEHVVVAPQGASFTTNTDAVLREAGLERRVSRVVTSFHLALPLLLDSDRIAVAPRSFAVRHVVQLPLQMRTLPISLPNAEMRLVWHPSFERELVHVWLRALVKEAVAACGLSRAQRRA